MDNIIVTLNESISAVDLQLDFERVLTRIRKRNSQTNPRLELVGAINDFCKDHAASSGHACFFAQVLLDDLTDPRTDSELHELLECLITVCESSRDAVKFLLENTCSGEKVFKYMKSDDALIKYDGLQLLKLLYGGDSISVVSAILKQPDVLGDIVEMTSGSSATFVRNESISLLVQLSSDACPELPSILSFQGAGDSLFAALMEDEDHLAHEEVSSQVIQCLRNLCSNSKSARYIRESGGCDMVGMFVEFALRPVLEHVRGIASNDSSEEDPEAQTARIEAGWVQTSGILGIAELLMEEMESSDMHAVFVSNGLTANLQICGESAFLTPQARARCYTFIAAVISGSEKCANTFMEEALDSAPPALWPMFQTLVDERTPLVVRTGIDAVVRAICSASITAQQQLLALVGMSPPDPEDPHADCPGRISTSILVYASEQSGKLGGIPNSTALAAQTWFALNSLNHFSIDLELRRSALAIRMTEELSLKDLVLLLARNAAVQENTVVACGALQLLSEWFLAFPSSIAVNIDLLKWVVEMVCNSLAVVQNVCVCFAAVLLIHGQQNIPHLQSAVTALVNAIEARIGLSGFHQLVSKLPSRRRPSPAPQGSLLPVFTQSFSNLLIPVSDAARQCILDMFLAAPPVRSSEEDVRILLEDQQAQIVQLQQLCDARQSNFLDYKARVTGGMQTILNENEKLHHLSHQLRLEIRANEAEILRLELLRIAEGKASSDLINELHQQVSALLISYNQLVEAGSPQTDMQDLLDLLRTIHERFPEVRPLTLPVFHPTV